MAGIFGGGSSTPSASPVTSLRLQTSTRGRPIPLAYGKPRLAGNLIWYGDLVATGHSQSAGGKGGSAPSSTTYTYTAGVIIGLCEGAINSIPRVWRQKEVFTGATTGSRVVNVQDEGYSVPGAPYQVKVSNSEYFTASASISRNGNLDSGGRVTLDKDVDYTVSADGIYTFAPSHAGDWVFISYSYTVNAGYQDACAQIGMSVAVGSYEQTAPGWIATKHPSEALAYRGLAYVSASGYALGNNADMLNHSFEIDTQSGYSATIRDANPKDVIVDLLTNPHYGAGFPLDKMGDMAQFSQYCVANNIFVSPTYLEQAPTREMLATLLTITNSGALYSGGKLKLLPFGDLPATANGVTYTPNVTPVYDLTDDDFLGDSSADPVQVTRKSNADAYNCVRVKFYNRDNNYNEEIVEAKDDASIEQFGLRAMDVMDIKELTDAAAARSVAQLVLQRSLYIRNQFSFSLGWDKALLEPMDLVTLTDAGLGMSKLPVRILSIEENDAGDLSVTAEEFPLNVCTAAVYNTQPAVGYAANFNAPAPDATVPVMFQPPRSLSSGLNELWIATSGGGDTSWGGADVWLSIDGDSYKKIGQITGPSRYGVSIDALPVGATPDTKRALNVDLGLSAGTLVSASAKDADAFATLAWLGGELIAYQNAELTAASKYKLSYLVRAGYGSKIINHDAGVPFVRLDDAIFRWEIPDELVNKRLHIKLVSFNTFGGGAQDLHSVTAYDYVPGAGTAGTPPVVAQPDDNIALTFDQFGNVLLNFVRIEDPSIILWELRVGASFDAGTFVAATRSGNYFQLPILSAVGNTYWIRPQYTSGLYGAMTYQVTFASGFLAAITGLAMQVNEPMLDFTWKEVQGADHYLIYFEEGGVTTVRTVLHGAVSIPIPKYPSNLRIYALSATSGLGVPFDQPVVVSGVYNLNEIVNINLPMNLGQYINMAFTNASQVEKVSLLGPATFTVPIASPNNAGLYSFGYNLKNVAGASLQNTPGSWFRQGFWNDSHGYFESAPVDLGAILTGRLKLSITKTVTPYGGGAGSAYAQVLGEYMANVTGLDLIDQKAFLTAVFYTCDTPLGPWVQINDGDWAMACRYVKIVIQAERISPLTDALVTAGTLTLDVPDLTESGICTAVTSAGKVVSLTKALNVANLVLLTPKGNCKVWATAISKLGFTINTDSAGPVDVSYFVKGY